MLGTKQASLAIATEAIGNPPPPGARASPPQVPPPPGLGCPAIAQKENEHRKMCRFGPHVAAEPQRRCRCRCWWRCMVSAVVLVVQEVSAVTGAASDVPRPNKQVCDAGPCR